MKDRDFLIWLHDRLVHVHGERNLDDYMHRLRTIIMNVDSNQHTTDIFHTNSSEELVTYLNEHQNEKKVKNFFSCLKTCIKGE